MKVLCIDTSTFNLSVALADDGNIITFKNVMMKKRMAEAIVPTIDKLLKQANWKIKNIDGFLVGLGPGSFTGLRVGLSTIKGFAFAFNKPVLGISSLDVLASAVKKSDEQICVMTDAKRQNVYSAVYARVGYKIIRVSEYYLGPLEGVVKLLKGAVVLTGDAIGIYKDEIVANLKKRKVRTHFTDERLWKPQAKFLPELGIQALATQKKCDLSAILPMYLYPEDCQVHR